jgi:hypothetical protein
MDETAGRGLIDKMWRGISLFDGARVLLNRRVGDKVKIRVPAGEKTLEILGIG